MLKAASRHNATDVASIARRLGMTVQATGSLELAGLNFETLDIACRDNTEALRLLNELAAFDAENRPKVRALAARLWEEENGDADAFARRAHRIVRDDIAFVDDEDQVFRSSDVTLTLAWGNCVNTARVLCALARAVGLEAIARPIRPHGEITHTAAQIRYGGRWHWAEATIAANFDEEPLAAARRLGILRDDISISKNPAATMNVGNLGAFCCATCARGT
jgi:hypothetical protein